MEKKIVIKPEIDLIDINSINSDIEIYPSNTDESYIYIDEEIESQQIKNSLSICERKYLNVIKNDTVLEEKAKKNIKLVISKNHHFGFIIKSQKGDINIRNLIIKYLAIEAIKGNISLDDVDIILAKLKNNYGNINLSIAESIGNYSAVISTKNGDIQYEALEEEKAVIFKEKRKFEATTLNGNIKVLFKGKK